MLNALNSSPKLVRIVLCVQVQFIFQVKNIITKDNWFYMNRWAWVFRFGGCVMILLFLFSFVPVSFDSFVNRINRNDVTEWESVLWVRAARAVSSVHLDYDRASPLFGWTFDKRNQIFGTCSVTQCALSSPQNHTKCKDLTVRGVALAGVRFCV